LYGIGDVLMSTPAVRNLKEQLDCEITYLHMFKTTHDILLNNPYIKENIFFPFLTSSKLEGIRFLLQFRKKFDYSINFYPSNRRDYNLAACIVASPVRIGHRYVIRDLVELNFLKNRTVREDDTLHNVEEDLRLLEFLGVRTRKTYPLDFFATEEEIHFADQWIRERRLEGRMFVGIHPGASEFKNHARKKWRRHPLSDLSTDLPFRCRTVYSWCSAGLRRSRCVLQSCQTYMMRKGCSQ